jgi:DNA-binding response OmpR family regulator
MSVKNLELLLVEDDIALGQAFSDLLSINGYTVNWYKNGFEAFEYLENHLPEVIVCDLMMPVMSGEELFLKIRKYKKFDLIPFIIITADVTSESRIKQLENGVNDFIHKPFKIKELILKIKNILDFKETLINQTKNPFQKDSPEYKKNIFFQKLDTVIVKNIKQNITIEKIANEIFVSKSTLDKKIRNFKNVNTTTYIKKIKLDYAIRLIEAGETNVDALASECGFNSTSYFSVCFKEFAKISPKKYIIHKR